MQPSALGIHFRKKNYSSVCTWSLSNTLTAADITLVACAMGCQMQNVGSNSIITIYMTLAAVVNVILHTTANGGFSIKCLYVTVGGAQTPPPPRGRG